MSLEVFAEGTEGLGFTALGGEEHPCLVQVHEEGEVLMPGAQAGLVHSDPPNVLVAHLGAGLARVVMDHAPETRVVLTDDPRHGRHRHALHEREHQRLEEEGEAATGAGPGHLRELDPAARAGHPWDAGMQVSLVLEEVQVPPRFLGGRLESESHLEEIHVAQPA